MAPQFRTSNLDYWPLTELLMYHSNIPRDCVIVHLVACVIILCISMCN